MDPKPTQEDGSRVLDDRSECSGGICESHSARDPQVFLFQGNLNEDFDRLSLGVSHEFRSNTWPMTDANIDSIFVESVTPVISSAWEVTKEHIDSSGGDILASADSPQTKRESSPSKRHSYRGRRERSRTPKDKTWAKSPSKDRLSSHKSKRYASKSNDKSKRSIQDVSSKLELVQDVTAAVKNTSTKDYFGNLVQPNRVPTMDLSLDASSARMESPSSSIASNKRGLEWDSGADVGYRFQAGPASPLSTIDRLALQSQATSMVYTLSGGEPLAESTPLEVTRKSNKESEIGISPILAAEVEAFNVDKSEGKLNFILFPRRKSDSSSLSAQSSDKESPVTIVRHRESTDKRTSVEDIEKLLERIGRNAVVHQTQINKIRSSNTYPPCRDFVPRKYYTEKETQYETTTARENCATCRADCKGAHKKVIVSVCNLTESTNERSASSGTSLRLDDEGSTSSCYLNETPRTNATNEQGTIGSANSFEYLPGHVYESNSKLSDGQDSSCDGSSWDVPNKSLQRDIEKGVEHFQKLFQGNREVGQKKREELCQKFVKKILGKDYSEDNESSVTGTSVVYVATCLDKSTQVDSSVSSTSSSNWRAPVTQSEKSLAARELAHINEKMKRLTNLKLILEHKQTLDNVSSSVRESSTSESPVWSSHVRLTPRSLATNLIPRTLPVTNRIPRTLPASNPIPCTLPATNLIPRTLPATNLIPRTLPATNRIPRTLPATYNEPQSLPATNASPRTLPATYNEPQSLPATNASPRTLPATYHKLRSLPTTNQEPRTCESSSSSNNTLDHKAKHGRINVFTAATSTQRDNEPSCCCHCPRKQGTPDIRWASQPHVVQPLSFDQNPHDQNPHDQNPHDQNPHDLASPLAYLLTVESPDATSSSADTSKHSLPQVRIKAKAHRLEEPRMKRNNDTRKQFDPTFRLTLQECLRLHRPDYIATADKRREVLSELALLRQMRHDARLRLIALNSHPSSQASDVPPTPLATRRIFSQRSMLRHTKKVQQKCAEVVNKKAETKRKEDYRTNRLMAEIFTRNLQKTVLKGAVNLSNSVSVISTLL